MSHSLWCYLLGGLTALPEQVGTLEAGPGGAVEGAADLGEPLPDLLDQRQDSQEGAVGGKALLRAGLDGVAEVVTDGLAGQVDGLGPPRVQGTHGGVAGEEPRALLRRRGSLVRR